MFLTKLYRRSAFKVSTGLFIVGAVFAAAGIFVMETGIIRDFLPENDIFLNIFMAILGVLFVWGIVSATIRANHIDHERQALQLASDMLLKHDGDHKGQLESLLEGGVFTKADLEKTDIAQLFRMMAHTKELNDRFYVDTERLMRKLEKKLGDDLSGLAESANTQTAFGFMGTVVGMIISFSTFGAEAAGAGAGGVSAVMQGLGFAMFTTLAGLVGGRLLRFVYVYLSQEAKVVLNRMEGVMVSLVDPVLNQHASNGMRKVRNDPNIYGRGGLL